MGNAAARRRRLQDEESTAALEAAEAAAAGARRTVAESHRVEEEEAAAAAAEAGEGGGEGAAADQAPIAGGLALPDQENAAAAGARTAVLVVVRLLPPAGRRVLSASDLRLIRDAAASGGAAGASGLAFMAALNDPLAANPPAIPQPIPVEAQRVDMDRVIAAAASGVWASCYGYVGCLPTKCHVNRWAMRLPPVLGASVGLAAAGYSYFAKSSDWVVLGLYGGLLSVFVMLTLGVLAIPLKKSASSESMSRHAAFSAFVTLIIIGTTALGTLFSETGFIIFSSIIGGIAVIGMIYLWCISSPY